MREPVKKSPPVQRKQVREVPPVQHDESDEAVPVQEGGGVGTADDPADQGHGVRDGDAHDEGQDRPKKPPDADNGGDGPVHTEGGGHVSVQAPVDDGGGAVSVQAEAGDDVIENIHGTGDVQVLAHTDEGGGVHNCVFDEHDHVDDEAEFTKEIGPAACSRRMVNGKW